MAATDLTGASLVRREDARFLTGTGQFTDDLGLEHELFGYVLRSPHAHACIDSVDTTEAASAGGVVAIYTSAELAAAGVAEIPSLTRSPEFGLTNRHGSQMPLADQFPLARVKVRYVGEPVAFVVAESQTCARDAAERIRVDYRPLPAVIDIDSALSADPALVWEELETNQSLDWLSGDEAATEAAMARAAHIEEIELDYPRVVVAFMEPRAALAAYTREDERLTLWAGTQCAHRTRDSLAEVLGLPAQRVRAVSPDMGGGFGARGALYPEFVLVAFAARDLGRPVRWTSERWESFVTDTQARDVRLRGELALDAEGCFSALRVRAKYRHGAYIPGRTIWALVPHLSLMLCGVYRIPTVSFAIHGGFTNTAPVAPLRGVARAEAAYLLESLVDAAARATGCNPVELRRKNLIAPGEMPWSTPTGACYDSGEFEANLDLALDAADWKGFSNRREISRSSGKLRGIGLSVYIENTMGAPAEHAEIAVGASGAVVIGVGTQNFGMGHETVFAQVAAAELGIDFDRIEIVYGDTDRVEAGAGSHGSRSMRICGTAVHRVAGKLIETAKGLAAERLEVARDDLEYVQGHFTVSGTDRSIELAEIARLAGEQGERLAERIDHHTDVPTYPNGCHVCEVEIDPETGALEILGHVLVADVGRAINPMIVHGQLHGGLAQGLGHVLGELAVYDSTTGQCVNGSFMDYPLPKADELPVFTTALNEVPTADNPLGVKGAGEGPTTGAPPAVCNAIRDALSEQGATLWAMPATTERIWRALKSGNREQVTGNRPEEDPSP